MREPLSIYLHWPFCGSKCPYCDFNSHVRPAVDERRWVKATITALDYWHERYSDRQIRTVFWGGGTPSLMSPGSVEGLISHIAGRWQLADDCEITLEANPTTHEAERFRGFRSAGVNRLSLGVQSFEQTALDFLGRTYTVAEAERAIASIAETFPRYSFDLIYALPDQSPERWRKQLAQALSFGSKHLSLYQLTFEPGTRFYQAMRMGRIIPLDDEAAADLYDYTVQTLTGGGLELYEISNFAVPSQECRHNLAYWTGGDWIGVGPGAHGRIGKAPHRVATSEWRSPERWLRSVEATGVGCETLSVLAEDEIAEELVLTGLRLAQGIDRAQFRAVSDRDLSTIIAADKLVQLTSSGLAISDNGSFRLTAAGRQILDAVVRYTLAR